MPVLSIVIPAFNEEKTIISILEKVRNCRLPDGIEKEIIVIDDCSKDSTASLVREYREKYPEVNIKLIVHAENRGKGAAIRNGIRLAEGDYLIIQDADLEYDPDEYTEMLQPVLNGVADVVYGSRFMGGKPHRILFFWHSIGNRLLTFISNMFTNLNLTDMETCYKLFRMEIIKSIQLKEDRFGFEPEVTAKVSRIPGIRIYEIGISYYGRQYQEGKKINWKDGLRALYCILKYNLFVRR
ncbi:MAG: glycosyltransferase family 2 protein [Sphingobacteriales bacterium]|nr:glycosyltransferase family 2 protein [Sphingobacteriales bacterium]